MRHAIIIGGFLCTCAGACALGWLLSKDPPILGAELKSILPTHGPNSYDKSQTKGGNSSSYSKNQNTPQCFKVILGSVADIDRLKSAASAPPKADTKTANGAKQIPAKPMNATERTNLVIKPAMTNLNFELQRAELVRVKFQTVDTVMGTTAMAVIPAPSQADIAQFNATIQQEVMKLPAEAQPYFSVDAQRMLDRYMDTENHTRLVYFWHGVESPTSTQLVTRFSEHITSSPQLFQLTKEGQRLGPPGVNMKTSRGWFDAANKPSFRYVHLFRLGDKGKN